MFCNIYLFFVSDFEFQETATCFIDRLMDEYTAYNDIIQPIQVAVYEMKFGLSLVLSSTLEKEYLIKIGQESINLVMVSCFKNIFISEFIYFFVHLTTDMMSLPGNDIQTYVLPPCCFMQVHFC